MSSATTKEEIGSGAVDLFFGFNNQTPSEEGSAVNAASDHNELVAFEYILIFCFVIISVVSLTVAVSTRALSRRAEVVGANRFVHRVH
jgi:hypothetical protein